MSETHEVAADNHASILEEVMDAAHHAAASALHLLAQIDGDWQAIKAHPLYGPLVGLAAKAAGNALATSGVPVPALVNVGLAVEGVLHALAAADPTISTPAPADAPAA